MIKTLGWIIWAVLPVLGLALHYGPGQDGLAYDDAAKIAARAAVAQEEADEAQAAAHATHLKTLEARKRLFLEGHDPDEPVDDAAAARLDTLRAEEARAYEEAAEAWRRVAATYEEAAARIDGTRASDAMRWAAARAKVRSGEVFNGIQDLQQLLRMYLETGEGDTPMGEAIREELAAAQYVGARLLREEGRPATVWRDVSGAARRHYRYLAERHREQTESDLGQPAQRNLEQVLDLEQSDRSQLDGMPLPLQSPRGRRPGDGEPGEGKGKKGKGPLKQGPPADGAGGRMPYGPGW